MTYLDEKYTQLQNKNHNGFYTIEKQKHRYIWQYHDGSIKSGRNFMDYNSTKDMYKKLSKDGYNIV